MMSATVAFSVGRTGSGGAPAAGVGCVRKNFIAVGPVRKDDEVGEQRIILITAESVTLVTGHSPQLDSARGASVIQKLATCMRRQLIVVVARVCTLK
jgi:hypothetical protein